MKKILLSLLAIFLLLEEWLWDVLTAVGQLLVQWLHLERFERWLRACSPTIALIAIAIPLLIVTPLNIAALMLLAQGLILQGIMMEIVAKLVGMLLVTRVFALTKPQLLSFKLLAWVYTTIMHWLNWAREKITDTAFYQWAKRLKAEVKQWLAHLMQQLSN